jgi:hypothetical protein
MVVVRDKEASTMVKKSFMYVSGVVIGVVGRPVGECAFLKSKYGYVTNYLKLQVMLEGTQKAKVIGLRKVAMVKYNGEKIARDTFNDQYKFAVENRTDEWKIKRNRGGRLLAMHLHAAAKDAPRTR